MQKVSTLLLAKTDVADASASANSATSKQLSEHKVSSNTLDGDKDKSVEFSSALKKAEEGKNGYKKEQVGSDGNHKLNHSDEQVKQESNKDCCQKSESKHSFNSSSDEVQDKLFQRSSKEQFDKNDKIEHVLKQINLANGLVDGENGDDLPLKAISPPVSDIKEEVDPEISQLINHLLSAGEDAGVELNDMTQEKITQLIQGTELSPSELLQLTQNTGLSLVELTQLTQATGVALADLVQLSPDKLLQLKESIELALADKKAITTTDPKQQITATPIDSDENVQFKSAQEKPSAVGGGQLKELIADERIEIQVKKSTNIFNPSQMSSAIQSSVLVNNQAGNGSIPSSILGEKNSIELNQLSSLTNTQPAAESMTRLASSASPIKQLVGEQQLKGADFSVVLQNVTSDNAAILGEREQGATNTISALPQQQNLIGKLDNVMQMQLSIKPLGDSANQLQEMVAKFSPVMKQQLIAMVSKGVQKAEIRLDPPELGSLMVRIQVQGEQTQVQFQVTQGQTKELVEQALPRLKEMLAEQGMMLTDSQVSQEDRQSGHEQSESDEDQTRYFTNNVDEMSAEESLLATNHPTSYSQAIDYYA